MFRINYVKTTKFKMINSTDKHKNLLIDSIKKL